VSARNNGDSEMTTAQFRDLKSAVPDAPANLDAIPSGATGIDLSWSASSGASIYHIERKGPGETTFTEIATTAGTSYHDSAVSPESTYSYRVRAGNSVGLSAYSLPIDETTPPPANPPAAPTALMATAMSQTMVKLSWQHNDILESGFILERSSNGLNYIPIANLPANSSAYTDTLVSAGQRYFYRVRATNSVGASAPSNIAQAITPQVDSYSSADINASPAGETRIIVADKHYDVTAGGTDIWDAADSFRFVHRMISGDFDMRVKIQSLTALAPTTKAGLMIRESLAPGSRHIFSAVTASDGLRLSYRPTTDGSSKHAFKGGTVSFPNAWIRLRRVGNVFTGFVSTDGITWTQTGTVNLALPNDLYFGMAVTAKSSTTTVTAQFRYLGTTGSPITNDPIIVLGVIPKSLLEEMTISSGQKRPADEVLT
jgi:regulation of enolase protein 1 (concanavalin A-like superfamily)